MTWRWDHSSKLFYLGVLAGAPLFMFLGAMLATCEVI